MLGFMSSTHGSDSARHLRGRALSQVIEIEEARLPSVLVLGTLLTAGLVFGAIGWAGVTPLVEVARTEGSIVPATRIHRIQHLEGGIVHAVHVREGDHVRAGDLLIELSTRASASEVQQIEARAAALELRLERLDALLADAPALTGPAAADPLQQRLFVEQREALAEQLGVVEAERRRLEQEVRSRAAQVAALEQSVAMLRERQRLQSEGHRRGAIARVDTLTAEANLAQSVGQLHAVQAEISVAREGIAGTGEKMAEIRTRWRQDLRLESEQVAAELAEARAQRLKLTDRLERTAITAPVAGVVQALTVHTLSSVVEPGAVVLELVPTEGELLAETRVEPKDIGYLRPGQRADVSIAGFESQRFGKLEGSLRSVSPSTYLDSEGRPYYRAEILLERGFLGNDPARNRLVPGMTVQAAIRTGEKTILEYLLKPVYRGLDQAMRER
jgi:HlyD family type I secretion membrane fusion protein